MTNWKTYKIGDIYKVTSGLSKPRSEFGFGYPFVTFKDVFYNFFIPEAIESLANTTEKERKSCSVKRGDIFLTRTSETMNELGMSAVALKDYENATFNGFTKRLRLKEEISVVVDPVFIGYYFRTPHIRNQIGMHASMTTRASLNSEAINSIEIEIPHIKTQVRIGEILKSLDNKIELNRRMNQTLEQMAQTLFKHYFVDGIDEDNLPEGWKKGRFDEIYENYDKKRIPLSNRQREERKGIFPYYGAASLVDYVNDFIFDGTYILLGEDGTVIDKNGYPILQYVWGKFWVNNHAHILQGKSVFSTNHLYILLKDTLVSHLVTGAVQPKINQTNLNNLVVTIPEEKLCMKFSKEIEPLFEMIKLNHNQIGNLTKTRDTLLPKLMSGEIDVMQAQKDYEQVLS